MLVVWVCSVVMVVLLLGCHGGYGVCGGADAVLVLLRGAADGVVEAAAMVLLVLLLWW